MKDLDIEFEDLIINDAPLPEHRLLYAILYRTAKDLFGSCPKERRSAVNFITKKHIRPYSFRWICLLLNLNHRVLINLFHQYKHSPENNEISRVLNGKQLVNQHGFLESTLPKLSLF